MITAGTPRDNPYRDYISLEGKRRGAVKYQGVLEPLKSDMEDHELPEANTLVCVTQFSTQKGDKLSTREGEGSGTALNAPAKLAVSTPLVFATGDAMSCHPELWLSIEGWFQRPCRDPMRNLILSDDQIWGGYWRAIGEQKCSHGHLPPWAPLNPDPSR